MKLFRRLVAWSCFLGFLAAVGTGAFHFVRYRPRCTIEANHENLKVEHLSHDGSRLVTCRWPLRKMPDAQAYQPRLAVLDTTSGQAVYIVEDFASELDWGDFNSCQSPDHRYLVGTRQDDTLLVDWQNGQSWPIEPPKRITTTATVTNDKGDTSEVEVIEEIMRDNRSTSCEFSPQGRWLIFGQQQVVEVATRRFVRGFPGLLGFIQGDRLAVFRQSGRQVRIWDMDKNQMAMSMPTNIDFDKYWSKSTLATGFGNWLIVAASGEFTSEGLGPREIVFQEAEVWDLTAQRRKLRIGGKGSKTSHLMVPRDGSRLVVWSKREHDYAVSIIELGVNDEQLTLPLSNPILLKHQAKKGSHWGLLGSNGKLFALARQDESGAALTFSIIDLVASRILWETREHSSLYFSPNGESVFCGDMFDSSCEKRDARTGLIQCKTFWSQETTQRSSDSQLIASADFDSSPEGAWCEWLVERLPAWCLPFGTAVVVAETETGRVRFRVALRDSPDLLLSGDGNTLVTIHSTLDDRLQPKTSSVRVWDVNPHRAWLWAVASSFLTGIVLLLLRCWRQTRKPQARLSQPVAS